MSKNLVIVESPHKATTLEKFLGKDYRVMASQGHVRDIEGSGKNSLGIDIANHYQPHYVIDAQKAHLIETLRSEAKKADTVWLASDLDREGEAIAWHLSEVLGLDEKKRKRVTFDAVTEETVLQGFQNPRDIDYNLVNAQQARRVMDRIVGFELSPILWRKISTGLSAGRVQSVAVRLVVEREREIEEFQTSSQYRILADFIGKNTDGADVTIRTELTQRFTSREEAEAFLQQMNAASFSIRDIQRKPSKKTPAPPFTTSLLQQEAARKLHFPVSKTMRIAQSLYEDGKITYMRTDSVNLSDLALNTAKQEVAKEYGAQYHKLRKYKTTSKGAQEAHEAIRPTFINQHTISGTADERNLYDLIWKRTIASQMADAEVETTRIEVAVNGTPYTFAASGEVVLFDGFMRAYVQSTDEDSEENSNILPQMQLGAPVAQTEMTATETFSKAPQRYNEATLVRKMEDLNIGRPSTYATIIETIQSRHYVENGNVAGKKVSITQLTLKNGKISSKQKSELLGAEAHKLLPTDLGRVTNDFLVEQFPSILSYDFTADAEKAFDEIAEGKENWTHTVDSFYQAFHPSTENVPVGKLPGRDLGVDPKTGLPVSAKISKNGPCIQLGSTESEDKPRFVSIPKGSSIFTITLEEACELFEHALPYTLGEMDGKEIVIGSAKYGPFIRYGNEFVSIPKNIDPLTITMEEVRQLIEKKNQMQEPIHQWGDIQVLNGRYGAYIRLGENNFKIPHGQDAASLTEEKCREIIANTDLSAPKKKPYFKKK